MIRTLRAIAGAAALALVAGAASAASSAPRIEWDSSCPAAAQGAASAAAMDCGWLVTGERLAGAPLRLRVVVLRARPDRHDATPVVYVPGGPGERAGLDVASLAAWRAWQQRAAWPQDIVIFDPRATGESRPKPDCGSLRPARREAARSAPTSAREFADDERAALRCYRAIGASTAAALGPAAQLRDLGALIDALDVSQVNLWGLSYGTRIARLFAARHPDRVRAMVLDSMFPFERDDLLALPAQIGGALDTLDRYCAQAADCSGAPPGRIARQLAQRYAEDAPSLSVADGQGGVQPFRVTPYRLLMAIVIAGYDADARADTVRRLRSAQRGDADALKPLVARLWRQAMGRESNEAVFWSTRCAFGDGRPERAQWQAALADYPGIAPYIRAAYDAPVCDRWRVPHFDAPAPDAPLAVPTLVLSGAADAVTPSVWGQRFMATHARAQRLVFADVGHGAAFASRCALTAMRDFWRQPDNVVKSDCARDAAQSGR